MSSSFIKKAEDFVCEKCGKDIIGNGYTNHCSNCLWSKHVDINPGDRAETCGGMMEPVKVENEKGEWILTHKCVKCEHEKRNKISSEDNLNEMQRVAKSFADRSGI